MKQQKNIRFQNNNFQEKHIENQPPLITIGITCFNAENTIENALESAFSQDWPNLEVLVVDDNSTDKSFEILKKWKAKKCLKIFKNKINKGCAYSRNILISKAKGFFIAFFDDDDISSSDRVRLQYKKLILYEKKKSINLVACYCSGERIYSNGHKLHIKSVGVSGIPPKGLEMADYLLFFHRSKGLAYGAGVPTSALFIRTTILKQIGGFDEKMRRQEDVDLAIRLAMKGSHFIGISEKVLNQYATKSKDKTAEIEYQSSLFLINKFYNYLNQKGLYEYMKMWIRLRYLHFSSNDFKAFLILLKIFIKYPIRTFKHFSKSSLKRFIHEIMIYSSSKNLKFKKECVRFFGQLLK